MSKSFADKLDESGVLDKIAENIVSLYTNPKVPNEIYQYFLGLFDATENADIEKLLTENQELRKKIASLKTQIAELEQKGKR